MFSNGISLIVQVHTFYEAVGYMISAQVDTYTQEQLIEKYMLLPNQVWDDIISQASKVRLLYNRLYALIYKLEFDS